MCHQGHGAAAAHGTVHSAGVIRSAASLSDPIFEASTSFCSPKRDKNSVDPHPIPATLTQVTTAQWVTGNLWRNICVVLDADYERRGLQPGSLFEISRRGTVDSSERGDGSEY